MPSYEEEKASFEGLNAQVLGISIDHIPCLQAWAESLGGITYPLLSDFWPHGSVSELYGVFRKDAGSSERAIFVIDPLGYIRYIDIHDIDDRPDNEVLREALRDVLRQDHQASAGSHFYDPTADVRQSLDAAETPQAELALSMPSSDDAPSPITLYCARWCKDCRRVKEWFDLRGLAYTEVDIDLDRQARTRIRQWANGYLVTPVLDICGTVVLDFNITKIEAALREHDLLS